MKLPAVVTGLFISVRSEFRQAADEGPSLRELKFLESRPNQNETNDSHTITICKDQLAGSNRRAFVIWVQPKRRISKEDQAEDRRSLLGDNYGDWI